MTEGERRLALKNFAATLFKNEKNHCQVLVDIYAKATGLARSITPIIPLEIGVMGGSRPTIHRWARGRNVTNALINDLTAVLIGSSMRTGEGRGKGPYFAGNIAGADGFKPELRDQWNQIQHATAGLVIGYEHGKPGEWFARLLEDGMWLSENPEDFLKLPEKMRRAIGDSTCLKPQPILQWSPEMLKNPPPTPSLWERETQRPR
jgi:hypothetical protein